MRGSYCYMPILPARYGAFRAVVSLSPIGKSRIAPMFDVPNVVLKANQTIDSYLEKRARESLDYLLARLRYASPYLRCVIEVR